MFQDVLSLKNSEHSQDADDFREPPGHFKKTVSFEPPRAQDRYREESDEFCSQESQAHREAVKSKSSLVSSKGVKNRRLNVFGIEESSEDC